MYFIKSSWKCGWLIRLKEPTMCPPVSHIRELPDARGAIIKHNKVFWVLKFSVDVAGEQRKKRHPVQVIGNVTFLKFIWSCCVIFFCTEIVTKSATEGIWLQNLSRQEPFSPRCDSLTAGAEAECKTNNTPHAENTEIYWNIISVLKTVNCNCTGRFIHGDHSCM